MANAPSNLGISASPSAGSKMQLANGQSNGFNTIGAGAGAGAASSSNSQQAAPTGAEAAANAQGLVFPALHLHPLNDTFAPKQISLAPPGFNNRIKIGRQTNAKTVPNPSNGYFDSKVLSRMHAEVWSQNGKVYIKDVKSSNGTFINSERLSPEAQESDVFELHNEDMVEFGIDIVGDDNKTIIHHKVACRVYLVLTAEDALGLRNDFASLYRGGMHGGPLGSNGVGPGAEGGLRKSKAGFSFDHVLSKLQSELQRSKDTWTELGNITHTMNDIHETLGGGIPPMTSAPYQHMVPPAPGSISAKQLQEQQAQEAADRSTTEAHSATISALQSQLSETQSSLAVHVEKIKSLEAVLAEHESIKQEVSSIKLQMEEAKRDMGEPSDFHNANGFNMLRGFKPRESTDDFDDGASIASMDTVMQGDETDSSKKRALGSEHVGPRAPPDMPTGLVSEDSADLDASQKPEITSVGGTHDQELRAQNAALSSRLEELASQLEQALALSRGLQTQHVQVTDTVKTLTERVQTLEKEVEQKTTSTSTPDSQGLLQSMEGRLTEFKTELEDGWRKERDGLQTEREELRNVVQAWDEANRRMEEQLNAELDDHETASDDADRAGSVLEKSGPSSEAGLPTSPGHKFGKSGGVRRKRHVNSALRSLLYGSSGAGLALGLHDTRQDQEVDWTRSTGQRRHSGDDDALSTSHSSRSIADSNSSTRPSTATEVTTPEASPSSLPGDPSTTASRGLDHHHGHKKGGYGNGNDRALPPPAVSAAAAAGVVFIGLSAYILMGKDITRINLTLPGRP